MWIWLCKQFRIAANFDNFEARLLAAVDDAVWGDLSDGVRGKTVDGKFITISNSISGQQEMATFIHEVLHTVRDNKGRDLPHPFIRIFSLLVAGHYCQQF